MEVYVSYECRVRIEGDTMEDIAAKFNSMGVTRLTDGTDVEFTKVTEVHDYDGDTDRTGEFERVFY